MFVRTLCQERKDYYRVTLQEDQLRIADLGEAEAKPATFEVLEGILGYDADKIAELAIAEALQ